MQGSFWKTVTLVGVIGVGILAILEVQNRLQDQKTPGILVPGDPSTADDRVVNADMTTSEFDEMLRAGFDGDALDEPPTQTSDSSGFHLSEPADATFASFAGNDSGSQADSTPVAGDASSDPASAFAGFDEAQATFAADDQSSVAETTLNPDSLSEGGNPFAAGTAAFAGGRQEEPMNDGTIQQTGFDSKTFDSTEVATSQPSPFAAQGGNSDSPAKGAASEMEFAPFDPGAVSNGDQADHSQPSVTASADPQFSNSPGRAVGQMEFFSGNSQPTPGSANPSDSVATRSGLDASPVTFEQEQPAFDTEERGPVDNGFAPFPGAGGFEASPANPQLHQPEWPRQPETSPANPNPANTGLTSPGPADSSPFFQPEEPEPAPRDRLMPVEDDPVPFPVDRRREPDARPSDDHPEFDRDSSDRTFGSDQTPGSLPFGADNDTDDETFSGREPPESDRGLAIPDRDSEIRDPFPPRMDSPGNFGGRSMEPADLRQDQDPGRTDFRNNEFGRDTLDQPSGRTDRSDSRFDERRFEEERRPLESAPRERTFEPRPLRDDEFQIDSRQDQFRDSRDNLRQFDRLNPVPENREDDRDRLLIDQRRPRSDREFRSEDRLDNRMRDDQPGSQPEGFDDGFPNRSIREVAPYLNDPDTSGPVGRNSGIREFGSDFSRDDRGGLQSFDQRRRDRSRGSMDVEDSRVRQVASVMRPRLVLKKEAPDNATVGTPLKYSIFVRNEGDASAYDVVVEDEVTSAARIDGALPQATRTSDGQRLRWEFDQIDPGESEEIQVQVTPTGEGVIDGVATFKFKSRVKSSTVVTAPRLVLEMQGPREARLGEQVAYRYKLTNEGNGEARSVFVRTVLPEDGGLQHPQGRDLEYEIPVMQPGEQREILLSVVAAKDGQQQAAAQVTCSNGSQDRAECRTEIIGAQLAMLRRGPKRRYVGKAAKYENLVTNETNFAALDARVIEQIPSGMRFQSAGQGGRYNASDRTVVWDIPRIGAGQTIPLQLELMPLQPGSQDSRVTIMENIGVSSDAYVSTTVVEDLHNISATTTQLDGPVPLNSTFGLTISVDNRGTADATDVEVTVEVPRQIKVKNASVEGTQQNQTSAELVEESNTVIYKKVIRIKPNERRDFELMLQGVTPAQNEKVIARVKYAQMNEPLVVSESVTIYDDRY